VGINRKNRNGIEDYSPSANTLLKSGINSVNNIRHTTETPRDNLVINVHETKDDKK